MGSNLCPGLPPVSRLPDTASRLFARVLNATTPGFHVVNYLGSRAAARVFHGARLVAHADRVILLTDPIRFTRASRADQRRTRP